MEREGRILTNDWSHYTADKVVFQPKQMTPEKLQELYYWAWDTFYADGGQQLKMGELFAQGDAEGGRTTAPTAATTASGAALPAGAPRGHEPGLPRLRRTPLRRPLPRLPDGDGGGRRGPRGAGARGAAVRPASSRRRIDGSAWAPRCATFGPDVVGFSLRNVDTEDSLNPDDSCSTRDRAASWSAARGLRRPGRARRPGLLHRCRRSSSSSLGADYGVVGEGEQAACDLVDALAAGRPWPRPDAPPRPAAGRASIGCRPLDPAIVRLLPGRPRA